MIAFERTVYNEAAARAPRRRFVTRFVQITGAVLALCLLQAGPRAQPAAYVRGLNVEPLVQEIRNAARSAGCNADQRLLDLVFALMTSHFGADAGHAEGLRQIATETTRKFSSVEDRVAVAAWEMELWHLSPMSPLDQNKAKARADAVRSMLPTAPKAHSRGGHDTEEAIVSIIEKLQDVGDPGSTVIVLLATAEASMLPPGSTGERLLGLNARRYRAAMENWIRRPAVRLRFESRRSGTTTWTPRQAEAVVVVPKTLVGRSGTVARGADRPDGPERHASWWEKLRLSLATWWPVGVFLVAAVLAAVGWLVGSRLSARGAGAQGGGPKARGASKISVVSDGEPQEYVLTDPEAPECLNVFATGTRADGKNSVFAEVVSGEAPQARLARLVLKGSSGVALEPDSIVRHVLVGGNVGTGTVRLPKGKHSIELRGQYQPDEFGAPENFVVRLNVSLE